MISVIITGLDVYPAHRTKEVIKLAGKLNIEMIFVPANGTGKYQPLDRKIFGIVKSIIRAEANKSKPLSGPERWHQIGINMKKAWSKINEKHLISAWNIDGLNKKVQILATMKPGANDDFIIHDYNDEFTNGKNYTEEEDDEEFEESFEEEDFIDNETNDN